MFKSLITVIEKAKKILIELFDMYEKVGVLEGANFYDFPEPIELFLYAPNIKNIKIKKLPEPVVYYAYQIASIYLEQNDIDKAIEYYKKAIEIDKTYVSAYINLGYHYEEKTDG